MRDLIKIFFWTSIVVAMHFGSSIYYTYLTEPIYATFISLSSIFSFVSLVLIHVIYIIFVFCKYPNKIGKNVMKWKKWAESWILEKISANLEKIKIFDKKIKVKCDFWTSEWHLNFEGNSLPSEAESVVRNIKKKMKRIVVPNKKRKDQP